MISVSQKRFAETVLRYLRVPVVQRVKHTLHRIHNYGEPDSGASAAHWHASLNIESGRKTHAGTQKNRKNRQHSSLTELGVRPLEGVCHAPYSHTSSNEEPEVVASDRDDVSPVFIWLVTQESEYYSRRLSPDPI